MMLMRSFLLFSLLCASVHALRPSHRAPVLFVITGMDTNQSEHRGTSIRTDGQWRFGYIDPLLEMRMRVVFPMATIQVVNTDAEEENLPRIREWIQRECVTIQRRPKDDCFVLSALTKGAYEPYKASLDPYDFRKWESSMKVKIKHALDPIEIKPLGSARPTFAITPSPVVPDACEDRTQRDCVGDECRWYGGFHRCKSGTFCGFTTKMACTPQTPSPMSKEGKKTLMECAREFTEAAGDAWPADGPEVMTPAEVDFLTRMCVDELIELLSTVYASDLAKSKLREFVSDAKILDQEPEPTPESQADAMCDVVYYIGNAAAKKGLNLDEVILEVHEANMRKAVDGKFVRRSDGKVIKPPGWIGPDVGAALRR